MIIARVAPKETCRLRKRENIVALRVPFGIIGQRKGARCAAAKGVIGRWIRGWVACGEDGSGTRRTECETACGGAIIKGSTIERIPRDGVSAGGTQGAIVTATRARVEICGGGAR